MAFGPDVPPIQVHLRVEGSDAAIAFYERALGAACTFRQPADDGVWVLHANLAINGGEVMPHDAFPVHSGDAAPPGRRRVATKTTSLNLGTAAEVDAAVAKAEQAGAAVTMPPGDLVWGARYGRVRYPFGHVRAFNAPNAA